MSEHLTQVEVYEVAAGEPVAPSVASHAVNCAECAAEVDATRRVIALVERLEPAVEAETDLDRRLDRRLDAAPSGSPRDVRRARSSRWLAGAAAAVICFAAGVGSHAAWTANRASAGDEDPGTRTPISLSVQQAGTDYVAAIATMVADSGRLSIEELRTGREVALAAMSGAAFELRQLDDDDPVAAELHQVVSRVRDGIAAGAGP